MGDKIVDCMQYAYWSEFALTAGLIAVMALIAWRRDTNIWQAFKILSGLARLKLHPTEVASTSAMVLLVLLIFVWEMYPCLSAQ